MPKSSKTDNKEEEPKFPIPDFLCGVGGCCFMPHPKYQPHTWEPQPKEKKWN